MLIAYCTHYSHIPLDPYGSLTRVGPTQTPLSPQSHSRSDTHSASRLSRTHKETQATTQAGLAVGRPFLNGNLVQCARASRASLRTQRIRRSSTLRYSDKIVFFLVAFVQVDGWQLDVAEIFRLAE